MLTMAVRFVISTSSGHRIDHRPDLLCSLQFFNNYEAGHKPAEALRLDTSPHYRFLSRKNQQQHEWHVTCIRILILGQNHMLNTSIQRSGSTYTLTKKAHSERTPSRYGTSLPGRGFCGLLLVDPQDDGIANRIRDLTMKGDRPAVSDTEPYHGLNQVLSDVVYTVIGTWNGFFNEAETHLQILVSLPHIPDGTRSGD
jgi:hypothetical protein